VRTVGRHHHEPKKIAKILEGIACFIVASRSTSLPQLYGSSRATADGHSAVAKGHCAKTAEHAGRDYRPCSEEQAGQCLCMHCCFLQQERRYGHQVAAPVLRIWCDLDQALSAHLIEAGSTRGVRDVNDTVEIACINRLPRLRADQPEEYFGTPSSSSQGKCFARQAPSAL